MQITHQRAQLSNYMWLLKIPIPAVTAEVRMINYFNLENV